MELVEEVTTSAKQKFTEDQEAIGEQKQCGMDSLHDMGHSNFVNSLHRCNFV